MVFGILHKGLIEVVVRMNQITDDAAYCGEKSSDGRGDVDLDLGGV
jgi:hypothetical protein